MKTLPQPAAVKCPLCGGRFVPEPSACQNCPLAGGCQLVCCPNCHYSFPAESKLINRLRIAWGRREPRRNQDDS